MKKFFRTAVGKTLLFILTMVSGLVTLGTVIGIVFMAEGNIYSQTQDQVYNDLIENMMVQDGRMILENHLFGDDADNLDMGNLEYEFLDGQQKVIASSQELNTSWDYSYYYRVETDGESYDYYYDPVGKDYQNKDTWGEVTWYTLNCSLKEELPEEDRYAWTATAVDLAY